MMTSIMGRQQRADHLEVVLRLLLKWQAQVLRSVLGKFGRGPSQVIRSVPHPELLPLSEEECTPPVFSRDPWLSVRDYSLKVLAYAKVHGRVPLDMQEYCYNNGISLTWEVIVNGKTRRKKVSGQSKRGRQQLETVI
jgi:hypothetical protein